MRINGDMVMDKYTFNGRQIIHPKHTIFNQPAPNYGKSSVKCDENLLKNGLSRHKIYNIKAYIGVPCIVYIKRGGKSS